MAHGDTQRRGGELGDASTLLDAQVAEAAPAPEAEDVSVDDATFARFSGDDVQELRADADSVVDAIGDDLDIAEAAIAALPAAVTPYGDDTFTFAGTATAVATIPVVANRTYLVEGYVYGSGLSNADGMEVSFVGPASYTAHGLWTRSDGNSDATTNYVEAEALTSTSTGNGRTRIRFTTFVVISSTAGDFVVKARNNAAARGTGRVFVTARLVPQV